MTESAAKVQLLIVTNVPSCRGTIPGNLTCRSPDTPLPQHVFPKIFTFIAQVLVLRPQPGVGEQRPRPQPSPGLAHQGRLPPAKCSKGEHSALPFGSHLGLPQVAPPTTSAGEQVEGQGWHVVQDELGALLAIDSSKCCLAEPRFLRQRQKCSRPRWQVARIKGSWESRTWHTAQVLKWSMEKHTASQWREFF